MTAKKVATLVTTLSAFATAVQPAFAQVTINPPVTPSLAITDISKIFSGVANMAIVIAAILVFFFLIWGGIEWLTSGGDKVKTENAQKRITAAVLGLGIVVAAWAIMKVIDAFFGIGLFSGSGITIPTIKQ